MRIQESPNFITTKSQIFDGLKLWIVIINNIVGDTWDFVDKYNIGINYTEETLASSLLDQSARSRTRAFFESMLSKDKFFHDIGEILYKVLPQK